MQPLSANPSEADLARQAAWLRRLARALTADPSTADDVAQDAWLKLARRPAPVGEGYVAAVVRSLAHTRWRGEARRAAREAVAARAEALPSAAEVGARVEAARRVAQALEELAEPYRTTLVLRYHDDLSAAEIARRRGVPAATVRSQLKRGLAELRARLDERGGGREAWLPALLPLARGEETAPGALAMSLTTVLAMKLALVGVLGAIALGVAWPFLPGSSRGERSSIAPSAAVGPNTRASAEASVRKDPASASSRSAVGDPTRGGGTTPDATVPPDEFRVSARAVDERGRPLDGAWMELARISERSPRSGTDGLIELALQPTTISALVGSDRAQSFALIVGARGRRAETLSVYLPEDGLTLALGDVELEPGATVSGRVLDTTGSTLHGARVAFGAPPLPGRDAITNGRLGPGESFMGSTESGSGTLFGTTDLDGSFRIEGIRAGYGVVWAATSDSRWSWSELIGLRAGDEVAGVEVLVERAPREAIAGRVFDPDGHVVRGAKITVLASDGSTGWTTSRSDAQGAFHFVAPEGLPQDITVEAPDWDWTTIVARSVPPGSTDLELRFERSDWWAIEVHAVDGSSLRAGSVVALPAEGPTQHAVPRSQAEIGADGHARLRRQEEPLRVRVTSPGYRAVVLGPFDPAAFPAPLTVALDPLHSLVGRVVDDAGEAVPGARVTLHLGAEAGSLDRYGPRFTEQTWSGDREPFVYELKPESMAVATTDALGRYRLPLPGVDSSAQAEVPLDASGPTAAFSTRQVDPIATSTAETPWYVRAQVAGNTGTTVGPLRFEGAQDVTVDLTLQPTGAIVGRLVLDSNASSAGWTMRAADGRGGLAHALVDETGGFRMEGVAPGAWQLSAFEPGKAFRKLARIRTQREPSMDVLVVAGQTVETIHHATRRASARLVGHVLVDGEPPGAWRVVARTERKVGVYASETLFLDPDGRFEVRLEPGLRNWVEIGSMRTPGFGGRFELPLRPGLNEWSVAFATARLEGRLAMESIPSRSFGDPVYRVELDGGVVSTHVRLDDEGRFGPIVVASGKGKLLGPLARPGDPAPVLVHLDLAPGEARTLDLR